MKYTAIISITLTAVCLSAFAASTDFPFTPFRIHHRHCIDYTLNIQDGQPLTIIGAEKSPSLKRKETMI